MAIQDPKEPADRPVNTLALEAPQPSLETPGWLQGGREPGRYRILRHVARGAYRPLQGDTRFVLNYQTDPHARLALRAYAAAVATVNPQLSRDLDAELDRIEASL